MEPFRNRVDAGRQLAAALPPLTAQDSLVMALPRGGVPVAAEICRAHRLPLDLVLVRKIGAPGQPELALGAIVNGDDPQLAVNEDVIRLFGLSSAEVERLADRQLAEISRRRKRYLGDQKPLGVAGKTVVLVDDGVATGASMRAALTSMRKRKAGRIVLALPVAPADTLAELSKEADETVCLRTPEPFFSVGNSYVDFGQTGGDEVARILVELRKESGA